ncbi:MAG TPA: AraC family transcriptional regulator [Phenylobacterium sp.]|jgi:AraC family transcriptional regulator|nr:AraC family transcriptional regulator [Phenylobacterium sp.]
MAGNLGKIHDVAEELARSAGAIANLTVLGAERRVPAHVHTNAYLSLHVLGGYRENGEDGEAVIDGPAAMFFPAGSAHEMAIGPQGLATVIIEFDSDRLRSTVGGGAEPGRARRWIGGEIGRRASRLARAWLSGTPDARRFAMTETFLTSALGAAPHRQAPAWLEDVEALVDAEGGVSGLAGLARQCGVSRPWLVRAYRHWRGEGIGEALRRRRVAAAAILLEGDDTPLAEVAAQAGFCDQSHMNRAFRRLVGRTPAAVRAARLGLAGPAANAPSACP